MTDSAMGCGKQGQGQIEKLEQISVQALVRHQHEMDAVARVVLGRPSSRSLMKSRDPEPAWSPRCPRSRCSAARAKPSRSRPRRSNYWPRS